MTMEQKVQKAVEHNNKSAAKALEDVKRKAAAELKAVSHLFVPCIVKCAQNSASRSGRLGAN
jgi:hypothetical protein